MKFLLVAVVALVVLFIAGVVAPRRSHTLQGWLERRSKKAEKRADRSGGTLGDWTGESLKKLRRGSGRSAESGRRLHDAIRRGVRG